MIGAMDGSQKVRLFGKSILGGCNIPSSFIFVVFDDGNTEK